MIMLERIDARVIGIDGMPITVKGHVKLHLGA